MANKRTYLNMGPTRVRRIPLKPDPHITNILDEFDVLYGMNPDENEEKEIESLMAMYEKAIRGLIKKFSSRRES